MPTEIIHTILVEEALSSEAIEKKKAIATESEEPEGRYKQGIADLANITSESSGTMATDDLDIPDEFSAIGMTEEDQQQILKKLDSLVVSKTCPTREENGQLLETPRSIRRY